MEFLTGDRMEELMGWMRTHEVLEAKLEDLTILLMESLLVQLREFPKEYLIKLQTVMLMALLRTRTKYLMDE